MRAGLEVALPARDRGIDLIAYADLDTRVPSFVARPIQMKAASDSVFGLDQKYAKFPDLLIAYVWNLARAQSVVTFALSYDEAFRVADRMGYAATESWRRGNYVNTRPGARLRDLLEPYLMTAEKWWERIVGGVARPV
jgi:hypothetical protein